MLQPITAKELEYIVDSMSNEDLLSKQCAVVASAASNPTLRSVCSQMVQVHQQHYQTLMNSLHQHQQLAPSQPQS
ncbi:hypothetical protein ACFO9Q_09425 [Paenibacillus sp. GCM10023252]|uniref:hypothetical protein n=1 Tax=Paenibacillus sp. GCM10023252 TaxID=3252649 RepID=UPI003623F775